MFLRERLKALRAGWEELHQIWEKRRQSLVQALRLHMFEKEAKQIDVLLTRQEHMLNKNEEPANLERTSALIKKHEAVLAVLEASGDKVGAVVQSANKLCADDHSASEKISKKAQDLVQRFNKNHDLASSQLKKLEDQLLLQQFLQDCKEFHDWIQEKNVLIQEDTYRSAKTLHAKWTHHHALELEIAANKERLETIHESGEELADAKEGMGEAIAPKLSELAEEFEALQQCLKDKGEQLFDAKRFDLYQQSCDNIDCFVADLEHQMDSEPIGDDLTTVNLLMQKQLTIDNEVLAKSEQVSELESQAERLRKLMPDREEEIEAKKLQVASKFSGIMEPMEKRRKELLAKKEVCQFLRDVDNEQLWLEEKRAAAGSVDFGKTLPEVTLLIKKNKMLKSEIDNHEPQIHNVSKKNFQQELN
jgi:spectrin beta